MIKKAPGLLGITKNKITNSKIYYVVKNLFVSKKWILRRLLTAKFGRKLNIRFKLAFRLGCRRGKFGNFELYRDLSYLQTFKTHLF